MYLNCGPVCDPSQLLVLLYLICGKKGPKNGTSTLTSAGPVKYSTIFGIVVTMDSDLFAR